MPSQRHYCFGPFRLDAQGHLLFRDGGMVRLAPKVIDVLLLLVENAGRVVEKDVLLGTVWRNTVVGESSLTRTISLLRSVLGESNSDQEYVITIAKRGYRFAAPVTEVAAGQVASVPVKLMLAVLPFGNLSGDPTQEYFSDGLTEEMITQLCRLNPARLGVIARTSTMTYKATAKTVQQIGSELGVAYVLEGSVRRAGGRVRITAQLVQVDDQTHLWGETYERSLGDILAVQSEVAQAIAKQIKIELAPGDRTGSIDAITVHPEAYALCLKGRYFWYKRTEQALRKGIEYFDHAIAHDSRYAPAYAGKADCFALLSCRGFVAPGAGFPRAIVAAASAIQLDGALGEAHASLAHVRLHRREWDGLEAALTHAIELNPSHAIAYHGYSEYLAINRRFAESIAVMRRAAYLDPLSPVLNTALAWAYYVAREYEPAIACLDKALEMDPNQFLVHFRRAQIVLEQGRHEEAIQAMQRAVVISDRSVETLAGLGQAYAAAGRGDDLHEVLTELEQLSATRYVSAYGMAKVHALADRDAAFAWLDKAYGECSADLIEIAVEPVFDILRSDPRFTDLLRRVAIPSGPSIDSGVPLQYPH
jgi:TolB-like protein/Flp pilus assembly protein TadD